MISETLFISGLAADPRELTRTRLRDWLVSTLTLIPPTARRTSRGFRLSWWTETRSHDSSRQPSLTGVTGSGGTTGTTGGVDIVYITENNAIIDERIIHRVARLESSKHE